MADRAADNTVDGCSDNTVDGIGSYSVFGAVFSGVSGGVVSKISASVEVGLYRSDLDGVFTVMVEEKESLTESWLDWW